MSFRAIYKCDICRDDTAKEQVVGAHFIGMKNFKLSAPESTQGVHICLGCIGQIYDQAHGVLHRSQSHTSDENG